MKIAYASDIHLEFGELLLENKENADVLVLAGDILVASKLKKVYFRHLAKQFFESVSFNFPETIMILGNHEHYDGEISESYHIIKEFVEPFKNIHILEKEYLDISGVRFIGCTLWTDVNRNNPDTHFCLKNNMNDFFVIRDKKIRFTTESMYSMHKESVEYIKSVSSGTCVLVTHHAPSTLSIHEKYKNDIQMNGGYVSDLFELFDTNKNIQVAIHGHVHTPFDYMFADTRIVCNPRGYAGYEKSSNNFSLAHVEVDK